MRLIDVDAVVGDILNNEGIQAAKRDIPIAKEIVGHFVKILQSAPTIKVAFLCDRRACENCNEFNECIRTSNITHAKNFTIENGTFVERNKDDET